MINLPPNQRQLKETTMSQTIYVKTSDPAAAALIRATFPGLSVKECAIRVYEHGGMGLESYWSGGTRDYHKVVELATMKVSAVPENGSGFTAVDREFGPEGIPVKLPAPGYAVVTYTDGNYTRLAISIHQDNAAKLLPAPVETTWAEKVVLTATRSLKSSYGGRTRQQQASSETGITAADYERAKASLISRGFLLKSGALSTEGKNAAGGKDLYWLAQERTAEVK
jgi:hypothetical protein